MTMLGKGLKRRGITPVALALACGCWVAACAATGEATASPDPTGVLVLRERQPTDVSGFGVVATPEAGVSRAPATAGAPAKQATSATLTWDRKGMNVVFDCADSGVVAEQQGRDNIKLWKDDSVYIWLDPGHTHSNAIMLQVSAGGGLLDARGADAKFDIKGAAAEVTRTGTGWCARITLPWDGLGVPCPKPGDVWGLNLTRLDQPGKADYWNMETSSWAPIPGGELTEVSSWGHILFAGPDAKPDDAALLKGRRALEAKHDAERE
jgi:hypothetical protein